jgi:hypothetical protein
MNRSTLITLSIGAWMAVTATASACDTCMKGMHVGTTEVLGNGMIWSWAKVKDGKPTSIGITFTESALTGLPSVKDMTGPEPTMEMIFTFPKAAKGIAFDHVGFHWNPVGHPPAQIYGVPHFDAHFYTISQEQRKGIVATGPDLKKCQKAPESRFVPTGYILPPDTIVPNMGAHWIDMKTPELNGKPFTSTFLYGTYNGQTAFWEPMVALSYLESKPSLVEDIKAPAEYDKSGYYPTRYRVSYNADRKEYTIALDGLTWREGAKPAVAAKPTAKKRR